MFRLVVLFFFTLRTELEQTDLLKVFRLLRISWVFFLFVFLIDKPECHAVLDLTDLGGFGLTLNGQSNLYHIQSICCKYVYILLLFFMVFNLFYFDFRF